MEADSKDVDFLELSFDMVRGRGEWQNRIYIPYPQLRIRWKKKKLYKIQKMLSFLWYYMYKRCKDYIIMNTIAFIKESNIG